MNNHSLYKKLKQTALDGNYTVEQVIKMTPSSASELAGGNVTFTQTFFENMKAGIIAELKERNEENQMLTVKAGIKSFLDNYYPDWKVERGREGDKPYVMIWLEGK